jgi:glycerol-3-phosphate dehydrogenase
MPNRSGTLAAVQAGSYDLCIIGGGASGAGCALDAQLRGLRTVLIEASDFASRTSSASTKMAHGGIRYLQAAVQNLDFPQYRLVAHALRERALMLSNAPHLTRPLEFLVPCFSNFDRLYYGIGMKMYDWIAGDSSLFPSRMVSRDDALRRLPALRRNGLTGAVSYADGQFDDARYGMALVNTFVRNGGTALNYTRAVAFEHAADGRIQSVSVVDELSKEAATIRARIFVNATGPFSDAVRRMASAGAPPRMRPGKGVHLLFPLDSRWRNDSLLVPKTEDGRVIFAIPYLGRLLVGTTDDAASPNDEMVVTRPEIDYLLRQVNPYLNAPLAAADIVSGFAGIRPLVQSGHSASTKQLIRDDEVEVDPRSGLISILGGKWTSYRLMAERTIDAVQRSAGLALGGCVTREHRLAGSERFHAAFWQELMAAGGIREATAQHLARKYGTDAVAVLQLAAGDPALGRPLVEGAAPLRAEVVYAVRSEMAATVEDVLARRIGLELYDWRLAMEAAPAVAGLMANELGWTATGRDRAASEYAAKIAHFLDAAGLAPSPVQASQ